MSSAEIEAAILALRLKGPMMACGTPSRGNNRPTGMFPGKGQAVGTVMAAMGAERDDTACIAELAALPMTVFKLCEGEVRMDYQTATDDGSGNPSIRRTDGKRRMVKKGEKVTVITRRFYVCNADYIIFLEGERNALERYKNALLRPRYCLYLGQATFLPTEDIFAGIYDSDDAALQMLDSLLGGKSVEFEADSPVETAVDQLRDYPIRFGDKGLYRRRFVRRGVYPED